MTRQQQPFLNHGNGVITELLARVRQDLEGGRVNLRGVHALVPYQYLEKLVDLVNTDRKPRSQIAGSAERDTD